MLSFEVSHNRSESGRKLTEVESDEWGELSNGVLNELALKGEVRILLDDSRRLCCVRDETGSDGAGNLQ